MNTPSLQKKVEDQILDSYEAMYRLAYTKVQQESYIRTWLWRIVMNTAVDYIRSRKNETELDAAGETGKEDTYQDFDTLEALKILDEREKAVVILRFFEDQKLDDIARILHENTNTVKTILYRSLKKLRVQLTEGELRYEG